MEFKLKGNYFNGQFILASNQDENLTKFSPADDQNHLWDLTVDYQQTSEVIASAQSALKSWRSLDHKKRADKLLAFQKEVEKRKEQIATAIALETGKPLWEAMGEAQAVQGKVSVTLNDSYPRVAGKTIPNLMPSIDGHIIHKPLGVCAVIGPFNFPCHLANTQILAALLTGNTVIFKPSEKTAYSAQLLIECFDAAGFPAGVINLLNGTAHSTQELIKHPCVKGIFFTGSLGVGQKILEAVGTDVTKLVALELGGKNSTIIHQDAHQEHSLTELLRSCFLTSGQRCTSASLVAVHESIFDNFTNEFTKLTKRIQIGHPLESKYKPFMGPLIDQEAVTKYNSACECGLNNGAKYLLGPQPPQLDYQGAYVGPSIHILEEAKKENPFTQLEIFGPNCTIVPYSTIEEAINIANISDFGLAAGVFTQDKDFYQQCLLEIDAGIINLNRSTVGAHAKLPFGGVKNSGNYHPAALAMIDHTVVTTSALETLDCSSRISDVPGLKD